jgi:NAD(P)-dependent dehydrogenase (short-subunit alcohol dehydrogenase family)
VVDVARGPVVVTGAGSGIGRAVAEAFAGQGASVLALARSTDATGELAATYENVVALSMDVTDEASVVDVAARVSRDHGKPSVLVTCAAAAAAAGPTESLALSAWRGALDCDLTGTFLSNREFGRPMLDVGYGRIVNLSSFHTVATYPQRAAYVAAKSGVEGLVKGLAVEWGGRGVTVNAVAPGPIRTPRTQFFLDSDPANEAGMVGRTPAGRIGELPDVVAAVSFLASPEAAWISGQVLVVDGGWTSNAWWGQHPFRP